MSIDTGATTQFYIGTTAAASDLSGYAADTYTEVGAMETIGDYGDSSLEVVYTGLDSARTVKVKGSRDSGNILLTFAFLSGDAGQAAMVAAHIDTAGEYNFKIELPNGDIRYFTGQVASLLENIEDADSILLIDSEVRINTAVLRTTAGAPVSNGIFSATGTGTWLSGGTWTSGMVWPA